MAATESTEIIPRFTRGPWQAAGYIITDCSGEAPIYSQPVATLHGYIEGLGANPGTPAHNKAMEAKSNGDLIAAAPELYAACDAMMQAIIVRLGDRTLHCDHDWPMPITDALCEELENMRRAIYKAVGKEAAQ